MNDHIPTIARSPHLRHEFFKTTAFGDFIANPVDPSRRQDLRSALIGYGEANFAIIEEQLLLVVGENHALKEHIAEVITEVREELAHASA